MSTDLPSNQPRFGEFVVLVASIGFALLSIACLMTMHWTEKITRQAS